MATCSTREVKRQEEVLSVAPAGHLLESPASLCWLSFRKGSLGGEAFPGTLGLLDGWAPSLNPTRWLPESWWPMSTTELVCRAQGSGREAESKWACSPAFPGGVWRREEIGWRRRSHGVVVIPAPCEGLGLSRGAGLELRELCPWDICSWRLWAPGAPWRPRTRTGAHVAETVRSPLLGRGSPAPPGSRELKGMGLGPEPWADFPPLTATYRRAS